MLLLFVALSRMWPTAAGRKRFGRLASKIRREVYGGLSSKELMSFRAAVFQDVQHVLSAAKLHAETFRGFRGAFKGRSVVLVGAGPTIVGFKPIPGAVHVGLNSACSLREIPLDYFFAIDDRGIATRTADIAARTCVKFIGDQGGAKGMQIAESTIPLLGRNVRRYLTDSGHLDSEDSRFAVDLETQPLGNFHTVAMQAMQFILYGQPERVYLAGIDCSADGHYDAADRKADEAATYSYGARQWAGSAKADWLRLKAFAEAYYPDTEIVSVNPVGLKGLFRDAVQEDGVLKM